MKEQFCSALRSPPPAPPPLKQLGQRRPDLPASQLAVSGSDYPPWRSRARTERPSPRRSRTTDGRSCPQVCLSRWTSVAPTRRCAQQRPLVRPAIRHARQHASTPGRPAGPPPAPAPHRRKAGCPRRRPPTPAEHDAAEADGLRLHVVESASHWRTAPRPGPLGRSRSAGRQPASAYHICGVLGRVQHLALHHPSVQSGSAIQPPTVGPSLTADVSHLPSQLGHCAGPQHAADSADQPGRRARSPTSPPSLSSTASGGGVPVLVGRRARRHMTKRGLLTHQV